MIIGVSGLPCSGSDAFCEMLEDKGFVFLSYSEILRDEARKRGVEITRLALQDLGDELRMKGGAGVLSKLLIENMIEGENYIVGNIRNPAEVEVLRERFGHRFVLVHVDAKQEIRFLRMLERNRESDPRDWEGFLSLEKKDLGEGQPEHGQQHGKVFYMADFKIENNSSSQNFGEKVEDFLGKIFGDKEFEGY